MNSKISRVTSRTYHYGKQINSCWKNQCINVSKTLTKNICINVWKTWTKSFTRQLRSRIHEKQCYDKAFRLNEHISDSYNDSTSSQVSNDSSVSTLLNNIDQYTTIYLKYKLRKSTECLILKIHNKFCKSVWNNKKIVFQQLSKNLFTATYVMKLC